MIFSCDLDDPDFQRFMKLEQDSAKLMENGVIENVFAFLIKMRPTQKYKTLMGMFDEIKSMITKKFKEHKETFDPGMLTIKLFVNLCTTLGTRHRTKTNKPTKETQHRNLKICAYLVSSKCSNKQNRIGGVIVNVLASIGSNQRL